MCSGIPLSQRLWTATHDQQQSGPSSHFSHRWPSPPSSTSPVSGLAGRVYVSFVLFSNKICVLEQFTFTEKLERYREFP